MHPYAYLAGAALGGLIAIGLFSELLNWLLYKRVMGGDSKGSRSASVVTAWLLACFAHFLGTPGDHLALLAYTIAAAIVLPIQRWVGTSKEEADAGDWYSN